MVVQDGKTGHRAVDYDVIALYENNNGGNDLAPIQPKEVPPQRLNPKPSDRLSHQCLH